MTTREFAPLPAPIMSRLKEAVLFREEKIFTIVGPGWELTSRAHAKEAAQMIGKHNAIRDYCARRPNDHIAQAILALLDGNAPD